MIRRPIRLLAVVMLAAAGTLTASPARAAGHPTDGLAHWRGRIVDERGNPLAFAEAVLYLRDANGYPSGMVSFEHTDDNGWYEGSVVPGRYVVWFTPYAAQPWGGYVDEYYPNTHDPAQAKDVEFRADSWTRLDARLDRTSTISGRLTVTGDVPANYFTPSVYDPKTEASAAGAIEEDGTFTITGIPHGTFYLTFSYYDEATDSFTVRYWPDSPTRDGARKIQLPRGRELTGYDMTIDMTG